MKIIEINSCGDCPYFDYSYTTDPFSYVCENTEVEDGRKGISNIKIIQKWCPLREGKPSQARIIKEVKSENNN